MNCDNSNSPLCTGEKGRGGCIFCDEYAQLTGSRIAYGGCYDRNDAPDEYCDQYAKEYTGTEFCMSICHNYEAVIIKGEHCDNIIRIIPMIACPNGGNAVGPEYCIPPINDPKEYCSMKPDSSICTGEEGKEGLFYCD